MLNTSGLRMLYQLLARHTSILLWARENFMRLTTGPTWGRVKVNFARIYACGQEISLDHP